MVNFAGRYISWEGGHALKRCEERGKEPSDVEKVIRTSGSVETRADGRYNIEWLHRRRDHADRRR